MLNIYQTHFLTNLRGKKSLPEFVAQIENVDYVN